ncbi:DNA primase [Rhabdothermincola sediminis]|uniref:DNA primase n=1 Tax=Rhabdothermincola sediminis TaxID=2751370 RepID=UPI001AA06A09|nr:DNA primase [Rhabdothermincola sediminis]
MAIVDEDIARVRQASDIVAVIGEHVSLRRVGMRWQGLCPFHAEKTPSFSVNQAEGLYYCFGCQARGDVITFVREVEHLDFVAAVEKLAGRAGISLRYTDEGESEGRRRKAALLDAVAKAVDWYHERLLRAPDAAKARGYLRSRGLDGDDVRRFRLGWAPDGWDELARALRLPDEVFVESGLGFLNRRNRQTDAFRGRVLFPIFDPQGRPVGFGGRILPGGEGPKYKNSPESAVYAKSKVLYGLHWVKSEIVAADEAIVCEGYTDVIGFAKAGLPRAVATCGTALTEDHVRLLRSFARRVVLAFDADAAGQSAADRFYAWERAHDLDVAVAALPAGVDPAELAMSDPAALRSAVETAVPFLGFRVNRALAAGDLSTAEGRARAAEAAMAVIAEHPNELVRDQYVMEVASRCRVDPERLRAGLGAPRRGKVVRVAGSHTTSPVWREGPELEALRLLIQHPDGMAPWLHESLFGDDLTLAAYRALRDAGSVREALEHTDPGAAELLQRLAVEESEAEVHDVAARLVEASSARALVDLQARARAAVDEEAFAALSREIAWLKLRIEELREAPSRVEAAEQLLAWLTDQPEEHE